MNALVRIYWLLFAVTLVVYAAMVLWTLPGIAREAGGLMPFDLRPTGYSAEAARAFLDTLGPDGLALYLGPQKWLDRAYPLLLALVLAGAAWRLIALRSLRAVVLAVIVAGMIADYRENMLVAEMLAASGEVSDAQVAAASRATVLKSALTGLAMLAVLIALGQRLWQRWRT